MSDVGSLLAFIAAVLSACFAGCSRRSIFGAGYSPRRATILSFSEKKEGKESASTQYHGHIHVFDLDGGYSLARPAGSNRGAFDSPKRAVDLPTQPAAGASRRPRGPRPATEGQRTRAVDVGAERTGRHRFGLSRHAWLHAATCGAKPCHCISGTSRDTSDCQRWCVPSAALAGTCLPSSANTNTPQRAATARKSR